MREVILPCPNPKCVEKLCRLAMDDNCYHFVECPTCGYHGPESRNSLSAIAAHNTIPRSLTWTTEPPKVEHVGKWFWSKIPGQSMAVPVIVAELDGVLGIGRGTSEQGLTMQTCREFGVKFAGPIAPPVEG